LSQIRHIADGSNPLTIEWKWSSKHLKIHIYGSIWFIIWFNMVNMVQYDLQYGWVWFIWLNMVYNMVEYGLIMWIRIC
jgi:hypothetical protein